MSFREDCAKLTLHVRGSFAKRRITAMVGERHLGSVTSIEPAQVGLDEAGYVNVRVLLGQCSFVEDPE